MITNQPSSDRGVRIGERSGRWSAAQDDEQLEGPALWIGGRGTGTEFFKVKPGWTRIGRSPLADIQLDDPSVSRRHALLIRTREEELRVIDDRSLNGIHINGRQTQWAPLLDGDEIAIGCFKLVVVGVGDRSAV